MIDNVLSKQCSLKAKIQNWNAQNAIWKDENFEFIELENWIWKICEFFEFFSFESNEFRIEIYRIFRTFFALSNQSNHKFLNGIERISNEFQQTSKWKGLPNMASKIHEA